MTDAHESTPRTGQEPADSTDSDPTPDDSELWVQESEKGYGDVKDGLIAGSIEPGYDEGATFRVESFAVIGPDEVPVAVTAEHDGAKISASAYLSPEQAEAFAEPLVEQAEEAREREEVYHG